MSLALGIGCDRDTPVDTLHAAVAQALSQCQSGWTDVSLVASIDLKADEVGLLALAAQQGWLVRFYPAAALARVVVPHPSETVRRYTGTPSVSEAAALLAAQADASALLVEKHKHQGADGRNATVSIARIPR